MSETLAVGWPNPTVRRGMRRGVLAITTTVVLTLLAPVHTGDLVWFERALHFMAAALFWEVAIAAVVQRGRQWPGFARPDTSLGLGMTVAVASVPATAALAMFLRCLTSGIGPFPVLYGQSLLLGLVIAFARRGLRFGVNRPIEALAVPAPASAAAAISSERKTTFVGQHAPTLVGRRLYALQAEDHYLRIHTDGGSVLVLMRMRDATAALGNEAGWQPHRSFWLAADAGGHATRRGQAWQIELDTGLMVPVSKAAGRAMRRAGYTTAS